MLKYLQFMTEMVARVWTSEPLTFARDRHSYNCHVRCEYITRVTKTPGHHRVLPPPPHPPPPGVGWCGPGSAVGKAYRCVLDKLLSCIVAEDAMAPHNTGVILGVHCCQGSIVPNEHYLVLLHERKRPAWPSPSRLHWFDL